MNRLEFLQTGGFPLNNERMDDMQEAYGLFNALGYIAGEKTILYGCGVSGAQTAPGFVFYNGEVLPFQGGLTQTTVKVIEETTSAQFEDGTTKPVHKKRYLAFGTGTGAIAWNTFKKIEPLKDIQSRILPANSNPQLYTGSVLSIPTGWKLCDGTNGTPDLRGKFIVGYNPADADYNAIGNTGGAKSVTLTEAQMPAHSHNGDTSSAGSHKHVGLTVKGSSRDVGDQGAYIITSNGEPNGDQSNGGETSLAGAHTHSVTTESKGGSQAHENRPPYYTLAYIIYTGQ